jgi:dienelactone hydrolase
METQMKAGSQGSADLHEQAQAAPRAEPAPARGGAALLLAFALLAGLLSGPACGGRLGPPGEEETDAGNGAPDAGADASHDAGSDAGPGARPDAGADAGGDAGPDAGADAGPAPDPTAAGPFATLTLDETISAQGDSLPLHVVYPSAAGPFPAVIIAHGFVLPASEYYSYAQRLATFGYVAATVDYPTSILGKPAHAKWALELSAGLDRLVARSAQTGDALAGKVGSSAGLIGHSLGGKLSILAAAKDARFDAVYLLDPVDGSANCNATDCPNAKDALPLPIPIAFLGETLDATGSLGQACAPSAQNYATLYAAAGAPALEVTVNGAGHMSFLDDLSKCGAACALCKTASADHTKVLDLAHGLEVAFFERRLRGDLRYDAWLTGPLGKARWVDPGLATIASR